jgi:HIV Tat-specific factor 1
MQAQASVYAVEGVDENVAIKPKEKKKRAATYDVSDPEVQQQKKTKQEPTKKVNTSVYVTGIPPDVTIEELKTKFSKCGVIMEDLETGEPKIKIYRDENGLSKGDALVSYFKEESVPLAIDLLDDSELRPGESATKMSVQVAVFKEKEPVEKKKSTTGKLKAKKKIQQLQRKFDWVEEEGGKKQEKFAKIVILKNMYTQEELDTDPTLLLELKEDVREECEKLGEVTNVILYDVSNRKQPLNLCV